MTNPSANTYSEPVLTCSSHASWSVTVTVWVMFSQCPFSGTQVLAFSAGLLGAGLLLTGAEGLLADFGASVTVVLASVLVEA